MVDKKELRAKFAKDWQKYYKLDFLVGAGFKRRVCAKCGKGFWTLDESRTHCPDQPCQYYEFLGNPPTKRKFDYVDAWKHIEKFFVRNGHTSVRRYPVVCRWFPTLFFNNASIVDFYRTENGNVVFDFPANPLVVPQFCLRFNDIPNIGVTGRHYGCFVMVGQHSLYNPKNKKNPGYWKDRCAELDFELMKSFGVAPEEIVFVEDVWVGPGAFGSTLEYFVRGLEIGNEVFTEFVITENGYKEMDEKVIDMGAGLERFAWLSQGTPTSYDVTFKPVLDALKKRLGKSAIDYDEKLFLEYSKLAGVLNFEEVEDLKKTKQALAKKLGVSVSELDRKIEPLQALYAICDHTRALAFAIADGALPSNVGGGYNLRVILRRALGFIDKFGWDIELPDVCELHAKQLKKMAPELGENTENMRKILDVEKRRYRETKTRTKKIVDKIISAGKSVDEQQLMKMYDSEGITPEMLVESGLDVKIPSDFYVKITDMHTMPTKEEQPQPFDLSGLPKTKILYYDEPEILEFGAKIVKIINGKGGEDGDKVVLDQTAFYPTSGGQLYDTGTIDEVEVTDVNKYGDVIIHTLKSAGGLKQNQNVRCEVDAARRKILRQHHTGNHIVNLSSRRLLGSHVWQHSAFKDVDKAKLEITHYDALSDDEVKKIEKYANEVVRRGVPVKVELLPRSEAEQKYGFRIYQGSQGVPSREVRVISIGDLDHAACGGLHCSNTADVESVTILHTKRVQDGVVRIEYVCGDVALRNLEGKAKLLKDTADVLGVAEKDVPRAVKKLFEEWKSKKKQLKKMKKKQQKQEKGKRQNKG